VSSDADGAAILAVRSISRRFGGLWALRDVTLTVSRGEIHGLIGPNGAGKTTLLNVISGVMAPSSGVVEVAGSSVSGLRSHAVAARGVSRTFQHPSLFAGMSVLENVMFAFDREAAADADGNGRGRASVRERALALLTAHGYQDLAHAAPRELPIATQKRIELVRAIARSPRVLLLDEPGAGLSLTELDDLRQWLRELSEARGIAILLVEHIMDVVMEVCSRVTVLSLGEVIASGKPGDVRSDGRVIEAYLGQSEACSNSSG
jgi:ABC-type branched-subunit amino acid transport system ATPase component